MIKIRNPGDGIDVGASLRDQGRYTAKDAAGYLGIPHATINSWFFGTTYHRKGEKAKTFAPVLEAANESAKLLSFNNLVEAFVLRRLRFNDAMDLRRIGKAIEQAKKELGVPKPLIHDGLFAGGKSLFLKHAGTLFGLDRPEQLLLPNAESYFKRVKYSDQAVAALYPVTRMDIEDSPEIVSISPEFGFGRSVIDSSKVATAVIFERYMNGDSVEDLQLDYRCKSIEIEEAIRAEWMFARGRNKAA
jgi:uncharacterized protein (DUF433 family)